MVKRGLSINIGRNRYQQVSLILLPLCFVPRCRPDSQESRLSHPTLLRKDYNNAVTRSEAERFWAFAPSGGGVKCFPWEGYLISVFSTF